MVKAEVLVTGLGLGESPRWHDGRLWFANWGTGEIRAVDLDGRDEVVARVDTLIPYCFDWLGDGRLAVVSGMAGVLLRQEADGSLATHADLRELAGGFLNEIVVHPNGNAYVNGGVIVLVKPDGEVRKVADELAFGNGMAITADGHTLIVAESYANRLTAFDIQDDGSLANRRVWAHLGEGNFPDGICLDAQGAVWYADVPNQHCVRVREGGEVLQTIDVDRGCFACMLGGPDGRTLFIVAAEWHGMENALDGMGSGQVLTARVEVPHAGRP